MRQTVILLWFWLVIAVLAACSADVDRQFAPAEGSGQHEVVIDLPTPVMGLTTTMVTKQGEQVEVRCGTCHGLMEAQTEADPLRRPEAFHTDFELVHGTLSCSSCHVRGGDAEHFRLADGRTLDGLEGRTLCGQCHSRQHSDYERGAHGGMNGYWDLTRGGRHRNDCVTCHNPHQPAFPRFNPAPGPRDRFLPSADQNSAAEH